MITLRFMTGNSLTHMLIRAQERTTFPFIPSHVEAVDPVSGKWIGAHADGGVMAREPGYDKISLLTWGPDHRPTELFVGVPATDEQTEIFYAFIRSKIGAPYDWGAIFDFAFPTADIDQQDHLICSALQTLGMSKALNILFACPAHQTSPRDLFLVLSGRQPMPWLTAMVP